MFKILIYCTISGFLIGKAFAQSPNVSFQTGANVLSAITITKNSDLYFGSYIPDAAGGGSVSLTPQTSTIIFASQSGVTPLDGNYVLASFTVTGSPATQYSITLPRSSTISNGAKTLDLSFTRYSIQGYSLTRTLNASGTDTFKCGGNLSFPAGSTTGNYTGTFTMTVNY